MKENENIKNKKLVNLFIIGIPRSSTSSLFMYLKEHPEIEASRAKELGYFYDMCSYKEYLNHFDFKKDIIMEATAIYIFDMEVIKKILRYNKDAKFIIMFREPKSLIKSMHNGFGSYYLKKINLEDKLKGELKRKYKGVFYADSENPKEYSLIDTVKRCYENVILCHKLIPKNNLLVLAMDDLVTNPNETYKRVLEFLKVKNLNFHPIFKQHNKATKAKFPLLNVLKRRLRNSMLKHPYNYFVPDKIKTLTYKLNIKEVDLSKEFKFGKQIDEIFKEDIKKIKKLIENYKK